MLASLLLQGSLPFLGVAPRMEVTPASVPAINELVLQVRLQVREHESKTPDKQRTGFKPTRQAIVVIDPLVSFIQQHELCKFVATCAGLAYDSPRTAGPSAGQSQTREPFGRTS